MVQRFFPNQQFAAFLFDFDGTVVDTMPVHLTAWNEALVHYGIQLTREQHLAWAGRPTREILKLLGEIHKIDVPADEFLKAKEVQYLNSLAEIKAIVPVMEIIKASFGKIPMAVVSGSRRKPIEATLKQLNLSHYFSLIVAAEDYKQGKPAPDCFLQAAHALKVKPEDCLVFEDANLGIEAARAAGMACLRVVEHDEMGHDLVLSHHKLQIMDTVEGNGKAAVKGALLLCHYDGYLTDGTLFDSSRKHGRPFQFVIGSGRVIKGWDQGLIGMKEGGKRTLHVPSHLGYGEREKGLIKPHSDLIFHVELLEVRVRDE